MDWQNEIRDVEYEIFDFVNENEINKPSNQTLKTFYEKNKKPLEIPKTRDIKYIQIKPSFFEDQVQINEKLVDEKYEIEKSNYIIEETREIFIKNRNEIKYIFRILIIGNNYVYNSFSDYPQQNNSQ